MLHFCNRDHWKHPAEEEHQTHEQAKGAYIGADIPECRTVLAPCGRHEISLQAHEDHKSFQPHAYVDNN